MGADNQRFYTLDNILRITRRGDDAQEGEQKLQFADGVTEEEQKRVTAIIEHLTNGAAYESNRDLESAYAHYKEAVSLGSVDAMRMTGNLYYHESFRAITVSAAENMARKMLRDGQNVFMPHDMMESKEPDCKTAFEWYSKAAEHGDLDSMHNTAMMLITGNGCPRDVERGKQYLQKAMEGGNVLSSAAYKEFFGAGGLVLEYKTNDAYTAMLRNFAVKADQNDPRAFDIHKELTLGTDAQLARLGYAIAKGRYNVGGIYEKFDYMRRKTGEPYAPVYFYNRSGWISCIKIDMDAFEEETVMLSVASDLHWISVKPGRWIKPAGEITYTSGAFGFLGERKKGTLLKVDKIFGDTYGSLTSFPISESLKEQITSTNATIFSENGEKEYSVEICRVTGGRITILHRYTIDGFDQGDRASAAKRLP